MVDASDRLNDELLKEKKKKFIKFVNRTVANLGYKSPKIRFWKDFCPTDMGNELAHIHLDEDPPIICISLRRLKHMTMDEVENTATHEAAHIGNPEHDSVLYFTISSEIVKNWKPQSGIQVIDGRGEPDLTPRKPYNPTKKECNYHSCKKRKNLKPCPLCKMIFCPDHLEPKAPAMFSSELHGTEDRVRDVNYHAEKGHPCLEYYDDYKTERKFISANKKIRPQRAKEHLQEGQDEETWFREQKEKIRQSEREEKTGKKAEKFVGSPYIEPEREVEKAPEDPKKWITWEKENEGEMLKQKSKLSPERQKEREEFLAKFDEKPSVWQKIRKLLRK